NLMTLGGLAAAVGLVIDDAIVLLENIVLHQDNGESRLQAIQSALREMTIPLVGSTITPVVVFLPLIFMTGVYGVVFRALAVTMTVALFSSLLLALTWTPTLSQYLLRRQRIPPSASPGGDSANFLGGASGGHETEKTHPASPPGRVVRVYERVMKAMLRRPLTLVLSSAAIVVLAYVCYQALDTDLLPEMDEGGFILDYWPPRGSSLPESNRILQHIEQILHATREVENTSRRTGLELGLAAVTEAHRGDFTVRLKPPPRRDIDEVMDDVRGQIESTEPGTRVE